MKVEYIPKTINYLKRNGLICTINKIWYSLEFFRYRKAIMYNKQLTVSNLCPSDDLNIKIASEEDIDEEYKDVWYTKKQALERLNKGHILFLAKDKGINIYYGWVELLNINIPWLGIKNLCIPSNIGYNCRAYVPPQYRGQRVFIRTYNFVEKYLLNDKTIDRVFLITAPDNVASHRSVTLSGYIPYQYVRYFKIMGLKLYIVESLQNKKSKIKKIFLQNSNFWNVFSSILKGS